MTPKISVVIPVYNAEPFLRQCLDSVVGQSFRDIEIICVDDGSTDASSEILREYQKQDPRIVVLTQKNQYAGVARNKGMDIAQGKYIVFWDADDYFDPNALAVLYDRAEETQADVVICESRVFDQENLQELDYNGTVNGPFIPEDMDVFSWREVGQNVFLFSAWSWDKLYNLAFLQRNGLKFETFRCSEDIVLVYGALILAEKIAYIEERLVTYRKFNHSSLDHTKGQSWQCTFLMIEALSTSLKKWGLWAELRQGFDNFILNNIRVVISIFDNIDAYVKMYAALRENVLKKYGLQGHNKDYFLMPGLYECLQKMASWNAREYLLWNQRTQFENIDRLASFLLNANHTCREQENTISSLRQIVSVFEERKHWVYPYEKLSLFSRLALYGAGNVGSDFYRQFQNTKDCHVTLWVDREFEKYRADGLPVDDPATLLDGGWDHVVIAVLRQETAESIRRDLVAMGIPEEKILWEDLLVGREDHDTF